MTLIARMGLLFCAIVLMASPAFTAHQDQPASPSQTSAPPQAEPATPQTQPQTTETPKESTQPSASEAPNESPKPTPPAKRSTRHRKRPTQTHSGKVVVRNGGVKESSIQLAPAMSKEQEARSRENTAKLLDSTDENLKSVSGRQLTPAQQSMLDEIHTYIRQSRNATDAGDLDRAHTLANKALLLSGELKKK